MPDDSNYSKRELDHYFDDMKTRLGKQDETLSQILVQTTKHNGRMSKVEFWIKTIQWVFVTLILPTIFLVVNKLI